MLNHVFQGRTWKTLFYETGGSVCTIFRGVSKLGMNQCAHVLRCSRISPRQSYRCVSQLARNHDIPNCPKSYDKEQKRSYGDRPVASKHGKNTRILVGVAFFVGSGAFVYYQKKRLKASQPGENVQRAALLSSSSDSKLPVYTADDVAKHDSREKRIWVSYKSGVYDITEFVDEHPGGDKIFMAAGGSLEPFWLLYQVHQKSEIVEMLEKFRVGSLHEKDRGQAVKDLEDPYAADPKRHPALRPTSVKPFNAEPPLSILVDSYITPSDVFYVRNHLPVPVIDPKEYELELLGIGVDETTLSLDDLKKFPKRTVTTTIQCAGNRRSEMVKLKPIKGLNWGAAAIGTATWSGALLTDVLKHAGFDGSKADAVNHVQFEGYDLDPSGSPYGASIPKEKALDPNEDVILAYEMNGRPLPPDHGFPVRVIVPGVVGARNVKWVNRIVLSEEESPSHWQQNDYKGFPPHVDWDTVDFKTAPAIQDLPVQSAICDPTEGDEVKAIDGKVTVRGYAWSGGGRGIVRVDVSVDGGENWNTAELEPSIMKLHRCWAWTLWKVEIPVAKLQSSKPEVCCRAVDSAYNTQPEFVGPIWNLRGVLTNSWHRVNFNVSGKSPSAAE